MRLKAITTYIVDAFRTNWVLVKIETDEGITGWGESTLEHRELTVAQAVAELEHGLTGRDLGDIHAWWQDAYRDAYWREGPVLTSALSGVEIALWDIKGKALGVPVYELLGGRVRESIPAYANGWFARARTAAEFAEHAQETVSRGYGALKWDPFGTAFRSISTAELREALICVDAVRTAVGPDVDLMIEGHGRFDLPSASRIAGELERFGVFRFEEPLIPQNMSAYATLRQRSTVPIAFGERLYTRWDFREVLERGLADFLQPDVSHAGGIQELRVIAALAETWQLGFCPHNPIGPIANAATLHLAASVPNFTYLETMSSDVPWRSEIATEPWRLEAGRVRIPPLPGLGVEIDEAALKNYPYQRHDLRHYNGDLTLIRPDDAVPTFVSRDED